MELVVREARDQRFGEGTPGQHLIERADDVNMLLEACFEHGVDRVLLYTENLSAHFFELGSGEAGVILQKLRTYGVRLALVRSPELHLSQRFMELLVDEQRGPDFRMFDTRPAAEAWLCEQG